MYKLNTFDDGFSFSELAVDGYNFRSVYKVRIDSRDDPLMNWKTFM